VRVKSFAATLTADSDFFVVVFAFVAFAFAAAAAFFLAAAVVVVVVVFFAAGALRGELRVLRRDFVDRSVSV
jgi:hypothetical protein